MSNIFSAADLRSQVAAILAAAGSSAGEARKVADNLVLANLSGHDSHGVGMVPRYVDAVLEGGLLPNAAAKATLDAGSLLSFDGSRGYGQVVGEQAMAAGCLDRNCRIPPHHAARNAAPGCRGVGLDPAAAQGVPHGVQAACGEHYGDAAARGNQGRERNEARGSLAMHHDDVVHRMRRRVREHVLARRG